MKFEETNLFKSSQVPSGSPMWICRVWEKSSSVHRLKEAKIGYKFAVVSWFFGTAWAYCSKDNTSYESIE